MHDSNNMWELQWVALKEPRQSRWTLLSVATASAGGVILKQWITRLGMAHDHSVAWNGTTAYSNICLPQPPKVLVTGLQAPPWTDLVRLVLV